MARMRRLVYDNFLDSYNSYGRKTAFLVADAANSGAELREYGRLPLLGEALSENPEEPYTNVLVLIPASGSSEAGSGTMKKISDKCPAEVYVLRDFPGWEVVERNPGGASEADKDTVSLCHALSDSFRGGDYGQADIFLLSDDHHVTGEDRAYHGPLEEAGVRFMKFSEMAKRRKRLETRGAPE